MFLFSDFSHGRTGSLSLDFAIFLQEEGANVTMEPDFWPLRAKMANYPQEIGVRQLHKWPRLNELARYVADRHLTRILLTNFDLNYGVDHTLKQYLMEDLGVGLYHTTHGWVSLPGFPDAAPVREIETLALAPLPDYEITQDKALHKACRKCGEIKPVSEFYRRAQKNARDPYRNYCKACFRGT